MEQKIIAAILSLLLVGCDLLRVTPLYWFAGNSAATSEPNPNPNTFSGAAYYHACGWINAWQDSGYKTESLAQCKERFVHDKHIDHTPGALVLPANESTAYIDAILRNAFDQAAWVHVF